MTEKELTISLGTIYHGRWVSGQVEANRRIYDFEFVYFSMGTARFITESQTFLCQPGTIIIVPPNLEHCTIGETACERWCIHFDWFNDCKAHRMKDKLWVFSDEQEAFDASLIAAPLPEAIGFSFPYHQQLPEPDGLQMLSKLDAFFGNDSESFAGRLRQQGLFLEILSLAFDAGKLPTTERRGNVHFFNAKTLLEQNCLDKSTQLASLAEKLQITPNHMNKLFRQHMGMTAMDYLQHLRLKHATDLLLKGNSVKAVAEESGFDDANYFARVFRAHFGISPREYKQRQP